MSTRRLTVGADVAIEQVCCGTAGFEGRNRVGAADRAPQITSLGVSISPMDISTLRVAGERAREMLLLGFAESLCWESLSGWTKPKTSQRGPSVVSGRLLAFLRPLSFSCVRVNLSAHITNLRVRIRHCQAADRHPRYSPRRARRGQVKGGGPRGLPRGQLCCSHVAWSRRQPVTAVEIACEFFATYATY